MDCRVCGNVTIKRRRTCSEDCLRKSLSKAGLKTCDKNRPIGERHYLWLGGKDRRSIKSKEYRLKYPERVRAHQRVTDAIRRGKIIRLPCNICGELKSEGHHEDYSKPLDVIWLCRIHHREADKKLGIGSKDF